MKREKTLKRKADRHIKALIKNGNYEVLAHYMTDTPYYTVNGSVGEICEIDKGKYMLVRDGVLWGNYSDITFTFTSLTDAAAYLAAMGYK